jgi:hypothetical protein
MMKIMTLAEAHRYFYIATLAFQGGLVEELAPYYGNFSVKFEGDATIYQFMGNEPVIVRF